MLIYLAQVEEPSDRSGFLHLYREYHKLMYYTAQRILTDHADAEDAVQEK